MRDLADARHVVEQRHVAVLDARVSRVEQTVAHPFVRGAQIDHTLHPERLELRDVGRGAALYAIGAVDDATPSEPAGLGLVPTEVPEVHERIEAAPLARAGAVEETG